MLETITLPEEALPGSEYSLDRSDEYILALSNPASMNEPSGVVYYTDSGTVYLANLTLVDRQGNPVRQYPRSQVYAYDENDQKICLLPCPEGEEVAEVYGLGGAMPIYWLDGHTAIFDCHSFIIFYDFAADSGQVLDDMNEIAAQFGRFSTYCGSQMGGVVDGTYYYLTRRETDPISGYTLWAADADGARELLDGLKTFLYDVVFCIYEEGEPEVEFVPLLDQELVAIVPPDHPLAAEDQILLSQLAPYPFITYMPHVQIYRDIMAYISQSGWTPQVFCNATGEASISSLVASGFGVSIVAKTDVLDNSQVKLLHLKDRLYKRTIYMAYRRDEEQPPSMQAFLRFVLQRARAQSDSQRHS